MKTIKRSTGLAAVIAAAVLVAGVTPDTAMAHKRAKAHKHYKKKHRTSSYSSSSRSVSTMSTSDRRIDAMEDEIRSLRSELNQSRSATDAAVAQHTQEVDAKIAEASKPKDLLFFRGGFAKMEHARYNELLTDNDRLRALSGNPVKAKDGDGWYVGAGFDHRLTDDLWGMDGSGTVAVDGEVMFQYMNFGSSFNTLVAAASNPLAGAPPGTITIKNQITQLTLSASPKIKFNLLNGDLRPWVIPFGLSINIVSPPASGVTVLNPGLMLGTGVEYRIWEQLWAGIDFRYNFTGDDLDYKTTVPGLGTVYNKTDTDGFTTGAYIGFGF